MRRVMCVYFPAWSLQRFVHDRPELKGKQVALSRAGRVPQVAVCSRRAAQAGVRAGMPIAEARAIAPTLDIYAEEPDSDLRVLKQLADWANRYSPIVGLEDSPVPQTLLIDITGCAACFHGEEKLLQRTLREFTEAGWAPRIAVADTIGAAWALAHYGDCRLPIADCRFSEHLQSLSVAALRLPADIVETLAQLGVEQIGALLALPREEVPARFGPAVLQRLDQALGTQPEVIAQQHTAAEIEAAQLLEYPTERLDALNYVLDGLMEQIQRELDKRNQAARQVACWLYHLTEPPLCIEVGLFRQRHCPQYLGMLLHAQLEQVRLQEPIRAVRLHILVAESLADQQTEFFATEPGGIEAAAALVDYLSNRLGPDAVTQAKMVPDFQPEYACRFEPLIGGARGEGRGARSKRRGARSKGRRVRGERNETGSEEQENTTSSPLASHLSLLVPRPSSLAPDPSPLIPDPSPLIPRPLRLWPRPVGIEVWSVVPDGPPFQLRWAGQDYRITNSWGPERIETGWWRGQDIQRDYYVIDTDQGTRLWIFRGQENGDWFLHGCFD